MSCEFIGKYNKFVATGNCKRIAESFWYDKRKQERENVDLKVIAKEHPREVGKGFDVDRNVG